MDSTEAVVLVACAMVVVGMVFGIAIGYSLAHQTNETSYSFIFGENSPAGLMIDPFEKNAINVRIDFLVADNTPLLRVIDGRRGVIGYENLYGWFSDNMGGTVVVRPEWGMVEIGFSSGSIFKEGDYWRVSFVVRTGE